MGIPSITFRLVTDSTASQSRQKVSKSSNEIYIEMPINIESKVLTRNFSMYHEELKQIFQRAAKTLQIHNGQGDM